MSGVTHTSHGHRSPLCTMGHNAGQLCTMQVSGAQHSPVLYSRGGAQHRFHKARQANGQAGRLYQMYAVVNAQTYQSTDIWLGILK